MARVMNKKVTTARKPLQSIKNKNTLVDIKEKNPGRASSAQITKNKATRAKQTAVRADNAYSKKATAADARRIWDYNNKRT